MTVRFAWLLAGATLAFQFVCSTFAAAAQRPEKPNIVFIVSDELGYYELSCMGNKNIRTPHIDRLAAEGIRFTQALAGASVCAPTRCCLMTGKHAGHTSVRANDGGTPLRAEEETVASMLKQAGYTTGGFGKWGCGGRGSTGVPEKHGFDVFFGYYDQVHAHSYYTPYLVRNSEEVPLPGNHGLSSGKTYSHYVIFDEAKKFIRENRQRPFFCYLPITPPHGIFDIPEDDPAWAVYKDKPWPDQAKKYAAMVGMVDRQVGELIALLKELGLDERTIIFLSGDNGGADYFRDADHPRGFHGANVDPRTGVEFRGHKGNLYEGGLRIPMIVRWPGQIEPGRTSDLLWYFPDVMPTLAELTGTKPPKDIDGISVLPELIGAAAAGHPQEQHEYLYWEYANQQAVRMGNWKAVRPKPDRPWELYDLSSDISEAHDVAAEHPEIVAKLAALAEEAHEPARPGTFLDRAPHERDRRAKYGDAAKPPWSRSVNEMPEKGLIPRKGMSLVSFSSESRSNGHLAVHAIDGDARTWWHTEFNPVLRKPPHELVIDLGREYTVRGIRYLARQDQSYNGSIRDCEIYLSTTPQFSAKPEATATFKATRQAQEATFEPRPARYLRLRVLSELNGGPWASIAELGVIGSP